MNTATVLDLIAAREAATTAACDDLREQIAKLSNELATLNAEIVDLQITPPDPDETHGSDRVCEDADGLSCKGR